MAKRSKDIWLTEREIGDILWKNWDEYFPDSIWGDYRRLKFRELPVNFGRPDFIVFSRQKNFSSRLIELYELKITASISSVIQILQYKTDLDEYIRQGFYCRGCDIHAFAPQVNMHLVARYFDSEIMEICFNLGIILWKVKVKSKAEIELESIDFQHFPKVTEMPDLIDKMEGFFTKEPVQ